MTGMGLGCGRQVSMRASTMVGSSRFRVVPWWLLCCGPILLSCDEPVKEANGTLLAEDQEDADEFRLTSVGASVLATPGPGSSSGNETSAVGFPSTNTIFVSYNSTTSSGGPGPA